MYKDLKRNIILINIQKVDVVTIIVITVIFTQDIIMRYIIHKRITLIADKLIAISTQLEFTTKDKTHILVIITVMLNVQAHATVTQA